MQAIHADNVTWKAQARGVREAKIYSAIQGSEETRIDMVEVPAGSYIPPHRHSSRTEFITILASAGAQLQIGERIFRPIAGQVFHREPGDILALTNDSQHPFCYSVVRFRYEASDVEHLGAVGGGAATTDEQLREQSAPRLEESAVVETPEESADQEPPSGEPTTLAEPSNANTETGDQEEPEESDDDSQDSKESKPTKKKTDSSDEKSGSGKTKKKSSKSNKKKK